jgi:uroporphyrinogen-III synthase
MTAQSHAYTVLLTRPLPQSLRFAKGLRAAVPEVTILIAPLMQPEFLDPVPENHNYSALILTSETGVEAARRISAKGQALPRRAYCVGDHTAQAAIAAGFEALSAKGSAAELIALICSHETAGPLLHVRGVDVRGDLAKSVTNRGIVTHEVVGYRQKDVPIDPATLDQIRQARHLVLPVFSPRSAALLAEAVASVLTVRPIVVAISAAAASAASALIPHQTVVAGAPEAQAMLSAVVDCMSLPRPA